MELESTGLPMGRSLKWAKGLVMLSAVLQKAQAFGVAGKEDINSF